tara:strand:- start:449 stop:730 length:282 start_codon:yes stop_codon:yes gene_type:complete
MNTTENNKLIAEFMGVGYVDIDTYLENSKELQYHNSWDWLMPVVNKCLNTYHIEQRNDDLNFTFYDAMGNMEETYQAVVEFINEHNKCTTTHH